MLSKVDHLVPRYWHTMSQNFHKYAFPFWRACEIVFPFKQAMSRRGLKKIVIVTITCLQAFDDECVGFIVSLLKKVPDQQNHFQRWLFCMNLMIRLHRRRGIFCECFDQMRHSKNQLRNRVIIPKNPRYRPIEIFGNSDTVNAYHIDCCSNAGVLPKRGCCLQVWRRGPLYVLHRQRTGGDTAVKPTWLGTSSWAEDFCSTQHWGQWPIRGQRNMHCWRHRSRWKSWNVVCWRRRNIRSVTVVMKNGRQTVWSSQNHVLLDFIGTYRTLDWWSSQNHVLLDFIGIYRT